MPDKNQFTAPIGEQTGRQSADGGQPVATLMGIPVVGRLAGGSMPGYTTSQLPGMAAIPAPGPGAYRDMLGHPTVALAAAIIGGQIGTAEFNFRSRPGTPQAWLDAIERAFKPLLPDAKRDMLLGLWFGWAPFEVIWDVVGGAKVPVRLKPLLPEKTKALADAFGNTVGLRNVGPDDGKVDLLGGKAFWWSNDPMFGDPYGRSRLLPARLPWGQSIQCGERQAQTARKVAGFLVQVHYPIGTSRDASGAERDNADIAQDLLNNIAAGRSVKLPNQFASSDDPTERAALAGESAWKISAIDLGSADIGGLLAASSEYDKAIFAGMGLSARTGLEATQSGSRADSQAHTDTATQHAQLTVDDQARALNRGPINATLVENFGAAAADAVFLVADPIQSNSDAINAALLNTMIADPNVGPGVVAKVDIDGLLQELDVKVNATPTPVPQPPKVETP